jgi:hypothetical protein
MRAAILFAIGVFAAPSSTAGAQVAPPRAIDPANVARGFSQLAGMIASTAMREADVNRDGAITHAEAVDAAVRYRMPFGLDPASWKAMDLNGDGVLAEREIADALRGVQARTSKGLRPF